MHISFAEIGVLLPMAGIPGHGTKLTVSQPTGVSRRTQISISTDATCTERR